MRLPQPYGRPHALVGVRRRHPYVRHHHVGQLALGVQVGDGLHQRLRVADAGHDVVPAVGQQPGQALPEQH